MKCRDVMLVPRGLPLKNWHNRLRCSQSYTLNQAKLIREWAVLSAENDYRDKPNRITLICDDEMRIEGMERQLRRESGELQRSNRTIPPAIVCDYED